jgi:8-oxo-dGTP pyrophosphatase MutT (NUDIX family)
VRFRFSGALPQQSVVIQPAAAPAAPCDAVLSAVVRVDTAAQRDALLATLSGQAAHAPVEPAFAPSVFLVEHARRGWELPGGKVDAGETAVQAAMREFEEETGISASAGPAWAREVASQLADPARWAALGEYVIEEPHRVHAKRVLVAVVHAHTQLLFGDDEPEDPTRAPASLTALTCLQGETRRAAIAPLMLLPGHAPAAECCEAHAASPQSSPSIAGNTQVPTRPCVGGRASPLLQDQVWPWVVRSLQRAVAQSITHDDGE